MIDPDLKRALGQMMQGVQVVGAAHDGLVRAYCSHWVCQVSFAEPIVVASVSPKHDTHPLIAASGRFSVSILAGDQVEVGQYFSYPGRRFRYMADEFLDEAEGLPVVRDCVAWMACDVIGRQKTVGLDGEGDGDVTVTALDHELFFARVAAAGVGRVGAPSLLYSSRAGWRVTGAKAREPGASIRDRLLTRLAAVEAADDEAVPVAAPER